MKWNVKKTKEFIVSFLNNQPSKVIVNHNALCAQTCLQLAAILMAE
jgi:hypothetical protein